MATVAIDIRVIGKKRTGDETVFLELCKKLIHKERDHAYYLLTDKTEEDLLLVKEKLGVTQELPHVTFFNFSPQNKFWWNAYTLPLFLREHTEIDVFHTQYILPFFLPKKLAVVAHIHDVSFARFPELISFKDRFFLRFLIPRTMSRATLVVPSVFTKQEIQEIYNVPAGRIIVITNAVSETFVSSLKATSLEDTNRVAQKYHLPKNYWLYVGTLQPRKNIPYLLQILWEIKKRVPTTKLVLVGDREGHHFDQRIDQALRELQLEKDVIFPGYITDEDLPALYQGAELFVFPSMYEGFGIPLLEALAAGTPVAASLIPPHQEVAGEAAAYFPLESLAIAAEILYNFSVKTQTAGLLKNGYIKPNLDFSWDTSAKNLAELYSRLAEK